MKTPRNPESVHPPLSSYTHQIEVSGPQRWLVLSGQVGMEQDGTLPEDPGEQLQLSLENIRRNLQAARMEIKDIVKLTIYLAGPPDNERRREVLSAWLGEHQPCMTLIYSAALANPKIRVELEALACTDVS